MTDTPRESESSPSGEPVAKVDTGEPPPTTPTPEVKVAPAPVPPEDGHSAPTSPHDDRSGTVLIGDVFDLGEGGRFTVKERLGRGGMGEVYRAEYVAPHAKEFVQVFALKVLRADALPRHERTFIDEVHLLSLLRHNHIARYHNFFVDQGRQVLVMEYVEGHSLDSILELARRKGRTLSESTSLELLAQIAEALSYAHAAKDEAGRPLHIVHRDVSPGNIMVNSAGFAMLVDFGVAKADLPDRTQTRSGEINIRGKLPYLSPEQVLSQPLDGRSDLFPLGSVLVEMLTGEPPFGRALEFATLQSTALVTLAYVDHVTRALSKKVRAICRKALARDPDQRFADGREMATAMLANHSCRGPSAVQEEIAALEALPDAPPVVRQEQVATELRRVKWKRRALEATGALAIALAAGFSLWISYSKPTAPPREQPMPPIVKADQGKPTVKDELKPEAATPAVANAAPAAPTGSSVLKKLAKCGVGAAMAAGVACVHTIQTGTQAGACPNADAVKREFEGKRIPDVIHVRLDESNPKGNCTGKWGQTHIMRDEPCPVYEGGEIIMRMTGGSQEEEEWGLGPDRTPWKKGMVEGIDWLWGRDGPKPSLLIGTTHRFDATGKYDVKGFGHPPRDLVGRMTALVTEIRRWDGERVPVCGVLYGHDGQVGVPIFSAPDYDKPTGGEWGDAYVKFFWPAKKK